MATCLTTIHSRASHSHEAQIHDLSVLPHMHSEDDIENMFLKIEAAPETANSRDWIPEDEDPAEGSARARGALRDKRRNVAGRERKVTRDTRKSHHARPGEFQ